MNGAFESQNLCPLVSKTISLIISPSIPTAERTQLEIYRA
ncbi:hypothetical protein LEP1GSC058_0304 [Leptospira fainei serovar Hurstbridge str. BUT 6]|uniref:Uncharacterized protein n=1 Tax=Leptospira fainei serovar Hurstbridge str. BUT 6 TaxID=1193011 RepID=S3W6X2_9LEPT|nr:hypothetical protein LEP1GSC058_0304 [Leptospira fainei serovar Hurstbridge str. BUT 6]